MGAQLIIEKGEGVPQTLEMDPGQVITLGRSKDNTIVLHDEHASRQHAQLYFEGDRWYLRDLGSFNGTQIDGQRVGQVTLLHSGQVLGIADMRLRFLHEASPGFGEQSSSSGTRLRVDELGVIYDYITTAVGTVDPNQVIENTLESIRKHSGATVIGFLNLDSENLLSKMVVPLKAEVDAILSKQLTRTIRETGKTAWLQAGQGLSPTDSLADYTDAICVPVKAKEDTMGALHVYKQRKTFTEREVRFCEIMAGLAAPILDNLRWQRRLEAENLRLRSGRRMLSEVLIGHSPAIENLRQQIARVADHAVNVLIQGETGAGKEVVAMTMHEMSKRRPGPFVVANCGGFSETLVDSELFGHCEGAFTGAISDHQGYFQQAENGTLLLDEVGDLPAPVQVKLLRVLEGKPFRPLGGNKEIRPDVRILAATNKDLQEEIQQGNFRSDLYFRLRVVFLQVPPLRAHAEDIPELASHLLKKLATKSGRSKVVSPAAMRVLQEFSWPGNIRQLGGVLENAVIFGNDGPTIEPQELVLTELKHESQPNFWHQEEVEKWALSKLLEKHADNITKAAEEYGIDRSTFRKKMKQYKIGQDLE